MLSLSLLSYSLSLLILYLVVVLSLSLSLSLSYSLPFSYSILNKIVQKSSDNNHGGTLAISPLLEPASLSPIPILCSTSVPSNGGGLIKRTNNIPK